MAIMLREHQKEALTKMKNGCILCGGVGSGKSLTAVAYYFFTQGGIYDNETYIPMPNPIDLYIITTARKRDTFEWDDELRPFLLSTNPSVNIYYNEVVVDSWNNIEKYADVSESFFIFDEQRAIGTGPWGQTFVKIARKNQWIMLSATPGDKWIEYGPVFVANGFYKNISEFKREHVIQSYYGGYPRIEGYNGRAKLNRLRRQILVPMPVERDTVQHHMDISVAYDHVTYKRIWRYRRNEETDEPFDNASELCYALRKAVNSHPTRIEKVKLIVSENDRVIIFYNFDFELDILKGADYGEEYVVAEWNGHKHEPIPSSAKWVYLVQYSAGAEGWNCIRTDTMIFYSQSYSYKTMVQAAGRMDRLNTPYRNLYYYHLKSNSPIDLAISRALADKKEFNAKAFVNS